MCGVGREASVSREISKLHEETRRGTLGELAEYFSQNNPRGEIVIIVAGNKELSPRPKHKNKYKNDIDDE